MTAWVQGEVHTLADLDAASRRHIADFVRESSDPTSTVSWYAEYEAILRERGLIDGAAKELSLLWTEVDGYSKDMAIARQIDQERRQRFARAMMAISQYVYQQQMLNALNRPRTCTAIGNTVTCY